MNKTPIPPAIKRNTAFFMASQALSYCVFQVVFILAGLVILSFTGSIALAGLAAAVVLGGRVLVGYHAGRLMDRIGRKPVLIIGVAVACFGLLLMAWAILLSRVELYWLGLFVSGLGSAVIQQNRVAIMDMYPAARRGEGMGYLMTASIAGSLFSPVLTAAMTFVAAAVGLNHYAVLLLASIPLLALAGVFIKLVSPDTKAIAQNIGSYYPEVSPKTKPELRAEGSSRVVVFAFPMVAAFVASALAWGNMAMNMSIVSVVLVGHGVELTLISAAVSLHIFGMFGLSVPMGWLTDRVGRRFVIMIGGMILGVGAVLMPITDNYLIITLAIFLVGLGWSGANVATTALITDLTPSERRGRLLGANDLTIGLTTVILPIAGGAILSSVGFFALALSGLVLALIVLSIAFLIRERSPGTYAV